MKNLRLTLIILLALLSAVNIARANDIPQDVMQRVQVDLDGDCLKLFLDKGGFIRQGYQSPHWEEQNAHVFAVGEFNSKYYCAWATKVWGKTLEEVEKAAIASCEAALPQGGSSCEVYARNNEIVYVNIHEQLKNAEKLLEAADVSAAELALNEVRDRKLFKLTSVEIGGYEYLRGKILINSKSEQDRAIGYFHNSWLQHSYVNGAVEEGNLRTMVGGIDKSWQAIREAYQYFLTHASDEQKLQHPEVEQNLKQTEPYYQADLAQKEKVKKEQAQIDAIKAKQQAKQVQLDAIKAEREARQQEKIRKFEAKRQAKLDAMLPAEPVGDGTADDSTCKSYGARRGTTEYINCRVLVGQTKQAEQVSQQLEKDRQMALQKQRKWEEDSSACKMVSQQSRTQAEQDTDSFTSSMLVLGALAGRSTTQPNTAAMNNMTATMNGRLAGQGRHEENMNNYANSVYKKCLETKGWNAQ